MKSKVPVLVLVGQTATGKSKCGVALAKKWNGEILSADSMQVYRGMEIATAQPTEEEKQGIPHHLMGFLEVWETFSVADYQQAAEEKAEDMMRRGKLPILVGGTGLYIDSFLQSVSFGEQVDTEKMDELFLQAQTEEGYQEIWERLQLADPLYAKKVHPHNKKRVLRALALFEATGLTREQRDQKSSGGKKYEPFFIGLRYRKKEELWDQINRRVASMQQRGLLKEASALYRGGRMGKTASQAIGYKELVPYFEQKMPLSEALEQISLHTRQYAKRQMTWIKRNKAIHWIEIREHGMEEEINALVSGWLEKRIYL